MRTCRACSNDIADDVRFCPHCGAATKDDVEVTVTSPEVGARVPRRVDAGSASSDSIDQARFTPGTILADRYRIVGLLGKGGMGEVYRADDLRLRQPVALKFLPESLGLDQRRLDRFHHEVRVARQVSHANVCRVYDIGEAEGHQFISMEYVDGEDLAKVLRRMGRPSTDKALQIARQLCAGLAAAHDKGVLHRDLKPHNIMIDGEGRVRITDFGLAGFVADFAGRDLRAGTPAYMAPEQLAGREVSVKSDIYALGLVLAELFTGSRVFGQDNRDVQSDSRSSAMTTLHTLADDVDPAIERVILRCLELEPSARPSSALAVAAALPGGDPLAAALEAGETPDPSMVAAAGGVGGMRPALAIPCLLVTLACYVTAIATIPMLHDYVALEKPPEVLADRAGEILKELGHTGSVADRAYGFGTDADYLDFIKKQKNVPNRWDQLRRNRPPAMLFWYRQSPRPLIPPPSVDHVTLRYPPFSMPGMATIELDPAGRLQYLAVLPPDYEPEPETHTPADPPDWSLLFARADLDQAAFTPTEPQWNPDMYCDQRAAWTGSYPDRPDEPIRIEAGAYRGKPTFFRMIGSWTKPLSAEQSNTESPIIPLFIIALLVSVVSASLIIARRNLAMRRGDRTGANRLAFVFLFVTLIGWTADVEHVGEPIAEFVRLIALLGLALVLTGTLWLLYIALEPFIRRTWPQTMIAWSRMLAGRVRDPLVGRDMLVGACVGSLAMAVLAVISRFGPRWFGVPAVQPIVADLDIAMSGSRIFAHVLNLQFAWGSLFLVFLLVLLKVLLRRQWLAMLAFMLLLTIPNAATTLQKQPPSGLILVLIGQLTFLGCIVFLLTRFGLVAVMTMFAVNGLVQRNIPVTLDSSAWYAGTTYVTLIVVAAICVYACHTALAGRSLFRDDLLEPAR